MALVTGFSHQPLDRVSVHGPVPCSFHSFRADGKRYLQLDTRGSKDRDFPEKVSQTLQLDSAGAKDLLTIILATFPIAELVG